MMWRARACLLASGAALLTNGICAVAWAADETAASGQAEPHSNNDQPAGFFERDTLTGSWGGLRDDLKTAGVALNATEIAETQGIVGGDRDGAIYEGRLELDLDLDLDRILGWENTVLHANAYQIQGRGVSESKLAGNLMTISNIEAIRAFHLFDLWVEKGLFDEAVSIRAGQLAADDEFLNSRYASTLMNSTFGWPAIMAQALPSGGPVFPLATPGIRIKGAPNDKISIQMAVFNGDPAAGPGETNPQIANSSGVSFNLNQNPLIIWEVSYTPDSDGQVTPATVYKLGALYHTERFNDLYRDRGGLSLADPRSSGDARQHQGNFGAYAVIDQLLYHDPGGEDLGLGAFLRLAGVPDDRNFVSFYADAGLSYKGPFAGRDDDVATLGFAYARISGQAQRLDADQRQFSGLDGRIPDFEAAIELTYQATLAPWWSVQPDFQYVFHPTQPGTLANAPEARIGNAAILGLRTSFRF